MGGKLFHHADSHFVPPFLDSVVHLGHILWYNLDDYDDILQAFSACRSNCIVQTFAGVDPFVKTKLVHVFCLSVYGSPLWKFSCKTISIIKVSFNEVLGGSGIYHRTPIQLLCIALPSFTVSPKELLHSGLCSPSSVVQCVSWILHICVILLLAITPSMETTFTRNTIQRTTNVLK